jgi:hypothetical protein
VSVLVGGKPESLLDSKIKMGLPPESIIPLRLAAANRWLAEGIAGVRVNNGMPPVHPGTPMQGKVLPGHDHSGGIQGKPFKQTIWHNCYGYKPSANLTYEQAPYEQQGTGAPSSIQVFDDVIRGLLIPGGKVYRTLTFEVTLICLGVASDYGIKVWGPETPVDSPYTASGSLTASAGGTRNNITVSNVPFKPGMLNSFRYSVFITYTTVGTSDVYVVNAALHQTSTSV